MPKQQQNTMGHNKLTPSTSTSTSTRRQGNVKVQSERQLRPSLSTMTRWDSERELGCDRPPQLKKRNNEEKTKEKRRKNNSNKNMRMVKAQSESHLIHSSTIKRRWKPNGAAAGVDRPPTLKHGSSFGSSALFNASFPLRSRSGDMNEPLVAPPSPSPSQPPLSSNHQQHRSTSSSPKFPSSNYLSPGCYKTKDSIITTTTATTSPSSVMSWFDNAHKQELVSLMDLNSNKNDNNKPMTSPPMRSTSCRTMPPRNPSITLSLQRHASSSSCMTTIGLITSAMALVDEMEGL